MASSSPPPTLKRPHGNGVSLPPPAKERRETPRLLSHVVSPFMEYQKGKSSFGHMLGLTEAESSLLQRIDDRNWVTEDLLVSPDRSSLREFDAGDEDELVSWWIPVDMIEALDNVTMTNIRRRRTPEANTLQQALREEAHHMDTRGRTDLDRDRLAFGDSIFWLLRGLLTPLNYTYLSERDLEAWLAVYGLDVGNREEGDVQRTMRQFFCQQNRLLMAIASTGWYSSPEQRRRLLHLCVGRRAMAKMVGTEVEMRLEPFFDIEEDVLRQWSRYHYTTHMTPNVDTLVCRTIALFREWFRGSAVVLEWSEQRKQWEAVAHEIDLDNAPEVEAKVQVMYDSYKRNILQERREKLNDKSLLQKWNPHITSPSSMLNSEIWRSLFPVDHVAFTTVDDYQDGPFVELTCKNMPSLAELRDAQNLHPLWFVSVSPGEKMTITDRPMEDLVDMETSEEEEEEEEEEEVPLVEERKEMEEEDEDEDEDEESSKSDEDEGDDDASSCSEES